MASLTRWTWVWVNSGSWWWTGRPGMLQFIGSQRVGHDWATELNWTDTEETFLVVQGLRICLVMQGTRVQSLVRETESPHALEQPSLHVPKLLSPPATRETMKWKIPRDATKTQCKQINKYAGKSFLQDLSYYWLILRDWRCRVKKRGQFGDRVSFSWDTIDIWHYDVMECLKYFYLAEMNTGLMLSLVKRQPPLLLAERGHIWSSL